MSYTTLQTQLGALLINLRKIHAMREHARLASDASYNRRQLVKANGFSTSDDEEAKAYGKELGHLDGSLVSRLQEEFTSLLGIMESPDGFFGVLAAEIAASKEDVEIGAIQYEYQEVLGERTILQRKGLWGALYRKMLADGQYIVPNVITPGSLTAANGNQGAVSWAGFGFFSHCPTGVLTFECVDENIASPKFRVSLAIDTGSILADGTALLSPDEDAQMTAEKYFSDGNIGLNGAKLDRSGLTAPTIAGDGDSLLANVEVQTPQDADCDTGIFHVTVERYESNSWQIQFFSDSGRTDYRGGFTITDEIVDTVNCNAFLLGGSIVNFDFDTAAAHAALASAGDKDSDISIDIETPRLGDKWTLAVTNDYAGNFSTKLLHCRRVSLPVSGSSQWTDSLAASVSVT